MVEGKTPKRRRKTNKNNNNFSEFFGVFSFYALTLPRLAV